MSARLMPAANSVSGTDTLLRSSGTIPKSIHPPEGAPSFHNSSPGHCSHEWLPSALVTRSRERNHRRVETAWKPRTCRPTRRISRGCGTTEQCRPMTENPHCSQARTQSEYPSTRKPATIPSALMRIGASGSSVATAGLRTRCCGVEREPLNVMIFAGRLLANQQDSA